MVNRRSAQDASVAETAAAAAKTAAAEAAADGIAAAQSAVTAARPGRPDQRTAVFVVLAKLVRGGGFKTLACLGTTAGLAALMLETAVRVEVVVLCIAGEYGHRNRHRAKQ